MKNLFYLFCILAYTACNLPDSTYTFTKTYERTVSVSRDMINNNIGKTIELQESFFSGLTLHIVLEEDQKSWNVQQIKSYSFWIRLKSPEGESVDFIQSVHATISFEGLDGETALSAQTVPTDYGVGFSSVKLIDPENDVVYSGLGLGEPEFDFTIHLYLIPGVEVEEDVVFEWDIVLKYGVAID